MDGWVIRAPRSPPSELPTSSTAPAPSTAPSRAPSVRAFSSRPPTSPQSPSPRPPSSTIEVRIPRPVDSPPQLQPLALLPVHDSTAYIEEKMLLGSSGAAADGNPLPANMGYLVGWTDLPAASIIVPAGDVLDYVSPRVLEQFEHEEWKRRKREEGEAQAALERRAEAKAKAVALGAGQQERILKKPGRPAGKRKRGPRKNLKVPVDEGAIQAEVRKRAGSQAPEGQPSLSSPQKGMKGLANGAGDEPATIVQQLYGVMEMDSETSYPVTSREESRDPSEPPRKKLRSSSPMKHEDFSRRATPGTSPTPRARLPVRTSAAPKPQEASPIITGFTPIIPPRPARQTPKARAPTPFESIEPSTEGPKRPGKPKKRKTPGKPRTPKPPDSATNLRAAKEEENEVRYEVKRLEDMNQIMVDGVRERYFLVRWKGDWPREENPTWEPEENLPPKLVRKFLAKRPDASLDKEAAPRRYSSVTEAFEGHGVEESGRNGVVLDGQDDDDMEKFQVTEGAAGSGALASQGGTPSQLLSKAFGIAFGRP